MTLLEHLSLYALLVGRGLRLRCPRCGRGKLFRRPFSFKMNEQCAYCGWVFEREEGYWTGAVAVNLVVTELLVTAYAVPFAALQYPIPLVIAGGLPFAILFPLLFYPLSKSLWMTVDFIIHPVPLW